MKSRRGCQIKFTLFFLSITELGIDYGMIIHFILMYNNMYKLSILDQTQEKLEFN